LLLSGLFELQRLLFLELTDLSIRYLEINADSLSFECH